MQFIAIILIILGLTKLFVASQAKVEHIPNNPLPLTKEQLNTLFQGLVVLDAIVCLLAGVYILWI